MPRTKYSNSNLKTCWDNNKESQISSIQKLIQYQFKENYNDKHVSLEATNEFIVLNDKEIECCPYCGSTSFIKHGFNKNKTQRYYCKDCKSHFSATTKTLLDHHKIALNNTIEFYINIIHFQSIKSAARNNKNSQRTGSYRIKKLFLCLLDYQNETILKGRVYIDSIFIKEKVGDKIKQHCVAVGFDGFNIYVKEFEQSHPTQKAYLECFKNHIEPGSTLVHDLEKSYAMLVSELNLKSISFDNSKKSVKGQNTTQIMEPLNNKIRFLKIFLRKHSSYCLKNLQDYLNLFAFIQNGPDDVLKKVEMILKMLYELPLTLKYSGFYAKFD